MNLNLKANATALVTTVIYNGDNEVASRGISLYAKTLKPNTLLAVEHPRVIGPFWIAGGLPVELSAWYPYRPEGHVDVAAAVYEKVFIRICSASMKCDLGETRDERVYPELEQTYWEEETIGYSPAHGRHSPRTVNPCHGIPLYRGLISNGQTLARCASDDLDKHIKQNVKSINMENNLSVMRQRLRRNCRIARKHRSGCRRSLGQTPRVH